MARLAVIGALAMAALAVLAPFPVQAQDGVPENNRLQAFLEVTGFDVALESIALSAAGAPEMLGMSAGDFGSEWSRVAAEVFAPKTLRAMAVDMLEQTLTDDLLTHATGFYASDLGRRLVLVENAAHLTDSEAKQAQGADLMRDAAPARQAALEGLVAVIEGADTGLRAVQEIQLRFLMAASNAGVLDYQLDEEMLRALLQRDQDEAREALHVSNINATAYTYRDISVADLLAYSDALGAPEMQQVYELMNAIQFEIMANRFELLAARMAELQPGQEL